jgi:hypothetical protein
MQSQLPSREKLHKADLFAKNQAETEFGQNGIIRVWSDSEISYARFTGIMNTGLFGKKDTTYIDLNRNCG